eukprot:3709490-Ditylum_brightwellii.AAC.1
MAETAKEEAGTGQLKDCEIMLATNNWMGSLSEVRASVVAKLDLIDFGCQNMSKEEPSDGNHHLQLGILL